MDKKIINWQYTLSQGEVDMPSKSHSRTDRKRKKRIVGVKIRHRAKIYTVETGNVRVRKGNKVILVTDDGGTFIGEVVTGPRKVNPNIHTGVKIIRRANQEDMEDLRNDIRIEREVQAYCIERIGFYKLSMNLVDVEKAFNENKITIYFTAEGRVDFRALLKDIVGKFRMRIELRQIGVRQEASIIGGIGPCGRPLCCATFLKDFTPVTIKMAKIQDIPLNPNKISGACGRLMCCLSFEHDFYEASKGELPDVGKRVKTVYGEGKVLRHNILRDTLTVGFDSGNSIEIKINDVEEVEKNGEFSG